MVCIPNAIPNLVRYDQLRQKLRAAVTATVHLENGQSWHISEAHITLSETAEWVAMERLCCPFLTFQLEPATESDYRLTLTGPPGTNDFLAAEFR